MYACGIAQKKNELKQITNETKICEKCSAEKERKILHHRSRTIIQLHAIVYAVIYYDFRAALWRLSVRNGLIYGLKQFSLAFMSLPELLREFARHFVHEARLK